MLSPITNEIVHESLWPNFVVARMVHHAFPSLRCHIMNVPLEIFHLVLKHLSGTDLLECGLIVLWAWSRFFNDIIFAVFVCRMWSRIVLNSTGLWSRCIANEFPKAAVMVFEHARQAQVCYFDLRFGSRPVRSAPRRRQLPVVKDLSLFAS